MTWPVRNLWCRPPGPSTCVLAEHGANVHTDALKTGSPLPSGLPLLLWLLTEAIDLSIRPSCVTLLCACTPSAVAMPTSIDATSDPVRVKLGFVVSGSRECGMAWRRCRPVLRIRPTTIATRDGFQ
ncbi:hypothetical protein GQ57_14960 [Burkholderia sp. MSh2]|nr:hypothetical protein GQ57_14960 [Burkholderia sp. MSh2]